MFVAPGDRLASEPRTPPVHNQAKDTIRERRTHDHRLSGAEVDAVHAGLRTPRNSQPQIEQAQTPRRFMDGLKVKAASSSNCCNLRARGIDVNLDLNGFTDHCNWSFVLWLRNPSWGTWTPMNRETTRLRILAGYRQKCRDIEEERMTIKWFDDTWTMFKE